MRDEVSKIGEGHGSAVPRRRDREEGDEPEEREKGAREQRLARHARIISRGLAGLADRSATGYDVVCSASWPGVARPLTCAEPVE
jgi:hypothetical protein